ncbi:hypothetical protein EG68_11935 [Paragonimus skrjabini miyazakii]|uniref:Uncharacterized protein n=1 Tax=Paragonimus skrjabini miyazakii TaxID=59628 RepID=A0A8S9YI77_9TREM|nr:hypothetical protein EG68_11935 [Paragonimus skrjabini miyazakii]
MYSVVVFDDQGEEACAVLSSSWVKNGIATWPSISGPSFGESVKLHLKPPPSSSRFPVTTIFQTSNVEQFQMIAFRRLPGGSALREEGRKYIRPGLF